MSQSQLGSHRARDVRVERMVWMLHLTARRVAARAAWSSSRRQLSAYRAERWFLRGIKWQPVDDVEQSIGETGKDFIRNMQTLQLSVRVVAPGALPAGTRVEPGVSLVRVAEPP